MRRWRIHEPLPRLAALLLLFLVSCALASCGWDEAETPVRRGRWQAWLPWNPAVDSATMHEVESLLLDRTGSRPLPDGIRHRWIVYCGSEVGWNRRYRIAGVVEPTWMDDSWHVDVEFPSGPGLRLHRGNPGIATPLYGDLRDTAFAIADGRPDTSEFGRRNLPCRDPRPRDAEDPVRSP